MPKEPGSMIIAPSREINNCPHQERIDPATHIGVCRLCGQERQYDCYNLKPPVIIKEGRVPEDPPATKEETKVSKEFTESTLKPENWDKMALKKKKKWFDENGQVILNDLAAIGNTETRKKWGIRTSTLIGLLRRWGEYHPARKGGERPAPQETKEPTISRKVQELLPIPMPFFPTFDKGWRQEVQIEWLKTYVEIVKAVYPGNK